MMRAELVRLGTTGKRGCSFAVQLCKMALMVQLFHCSGVLTRRNTSVMVTWTLFPRWVSIG